MPHRLLEWCQDAASNASDQGGYTTERYIEMGAAWYIRAIVLSIQAPTTASHRVEVETWVSSVRRFRSRREYVVYSDGAPTAAAHVDWLFLRQDPDTRKVTPFHFDDAMLAAFPVEAAEAIASEQVPPWPRTVTPAHTSIRTARPSETDRHGHVNHVHYAAWLIDHAQESHPDLGPLHFLRLQYQADVQPGESVELQLETTDEGAHHRIVRGDQAVARAVTRFAPI